MTVEVVHGTSFACGLGVTQRRTCETESSHDEACCAVTAVSWNVHIEAVKRSASRFGDVSGQHRRRGSGPLDRLKKKVT